MVISMTHHCHVDPVAGLIGTGDAKLCCSRVLCPDLVAALLPRIHTLLAPTDPNQQAHNNDGQHNFEHLQQTYIALLNTEVPLCFRASTLCLCLQTQRHAQASTQQ